MAVSTLPPVIKSQPAVEKLNTFAGYTVTVTRHMTPRAVGGQSIVATQTMTLKQIFDLQVSLPLSHGAGHYYFNVVDAGGTGSDEWMVKLGPEQPQEASMVGPATPFPSNANNAPPAGEGVTHLGHGFYHNEILSTLTTPWRTIVNWKPGDPMPVQPASTQAGAAAQSTPWWNNPQQPSAWGAQPGWGNFPINSGESEELKLAKMQLEEMKRVNEANERRHEAAERQKREDERERRQEERDRQRDQEFRTIVATLTAKPAVDPAVEEIKRQNEELRRETERIRQENVQRERDANFRAEQQTQQARFETTIRELTANKSDPMLTMLMQMMNQMNTSSMEAVKAIQSSQSNANTAAERNIQQLVGQLQATQMSPLQLIQIMQQAKGDGAEAGKLFIEAAKESMQMQKTVFEQMLELRGSGDQPAWVSVVQGALDKIGGLGQAMMERNERDAARQEYTPPQPRVQVPQQQHVVQRAQPQVAQPPARPAVTPIPSRVANTTPQRPEGTRYDAKADEFVLADGRRIKNTDVEKHGWGVVMADPEMNGFSQLPQQVPPVVVVEPEPGSMNGAAGHAAPASPPPTPITRGRTKRKPHRPAKRRPTPVGVSRGYTVAELKEMEPDDIRVLTDSMDDQAFFGMLATYVPQMRLSNGGTPPPAEVAKYVKQAEAFVKNTPGATMPVAIELLYAEQLVVLAEKIFPGAEEAYIDDVAGAIAEAFGIEGDDEEEESEEAGG